MSRRSRDLALAGHQLVLDPVGVDDTEASKVAGFGPEDHIAVGFRHRTA